MDNQDKQKIEKLQQKKPWHEPVCQPIEVGNKTLSSTGSNDDGWLAQS